MAAGLTRLTLHRSDSPDGLARLTEGAPPKDPVEAARRYLHRAFGATRGLVPEASGLRHVATTDEPLTNTRFVKFVQTVHGIPLYGSIATVEMDPSNHFVSLSSQTGAPDVGPTPSLTASQALATVAADAGHSLDDLRAIVPSLTYYNDGDAWHLGWLMRDVQSGTTPDLYDYLVDARSGEILARLPRSASANSGNESPL